MCIKYEIDEHMSPYNDS